MADGSSRVEIGYLEKSEAWKLESRFFPSKVGGKPAWLDFKNINFNVNCSRCSKPCIFLCQLYAPLTERLETYHRTLYVFVCRDPDCSKSNDNGNFVVLRCQMGQCNEFYSRDEPEERDDWCAEVRVEKYSRICVLCGCFAPNHCGKCKRTKYCSREHQLIDWKGGHKEKCGFSDGRSVNILFPEYEIINESEILNEEEASMMSKPVEKSEEEKMKEYESYVSRFKDVAVSNADLKIIEQLALGKEDKYFQKFKERLKICPDQVVRYERGGEPLWISKPNLPAVPNCENCNSPREFEFQILPTLLNSLDVDRLEKSIDWGTLLVYTCKASCNGEPSYKKEFLWKQDVDE